MGLNLDMSQEEKGCDQKDAQNPIVSGPQDQVRKRCAFKLNRYPTHMQVQRSALKRNQRTEGKPSSDRGRGKEIESQ